MTEFELIERYFGACAGNQYVHLGVGDDAALTIVPPGHELVTTVDTLVAGVHFFADCDAGSLGYKALAVNLSDLAAMGATPAWFTLALALPAAEPDWLSRFAEGLRDLAAEHDMALVGGDTVRGPLTITIQACGLVPEGQALRRDGARPGDAIYLTGTLGDARLALEHLEGRHQIASVNRQALLERLQRPQARIKEGAALRAIASAAIDISDGLVADLSHILERSRVGARIEPARLPLSAAMQHSLPRAQAEELALYGGDDYELCFTVPVAKEGEMQALLAAGAIVARRIGTIVEGDSVVCLRADGDSYTADKRGYNHFSKGV